jgi:hypothetical protein
MKITFKTPDFRQAIATLEGVEKKKLEQISEEIEDSANIIVAVAQNTAPVNENRLRGSISAKKLTPYQYEVVAQTKYAAFMEFGTKSKVRIPAGAEEIAAEARNIKGGTIAEMQKSIERWVRLKGIAKGKEIKNVTFLIMRKILRVGVNPQPFFFPSIQKEIPNLTKKLKQIIDRS